MIITLMKLIIIIMIIIIIAPGSLASLLPWFLGASGFELDRFTKM